MADCKEIYQKEIWIVLKIDMIKGGYTFIGAYWLKEDAKQVAVQNITNEVYISITIQNVMLHGSMIDKT